MSTVRSKIFIYDENSINCRFRVNKSHQGRVGVKIVSHRILTMLILYGYQSRCSHIVEIPAFHLLKSFPIYDDLLSEYLVNAINDFLTLVMTFIPNMRGKADLKR